MTSGSRLRGLVLLPAALLAALLAGACGGGGRSDTAPLRVSGSTTVNPVAADAAEALRAEGIRVTVDSQGGSAGGLAQLVAGQVEVAMSSKPLSVAERTMHPGVELFPTEIGRDAVGVVVRREVFEGGVRSLTRAELIALFEGRVANWREVGGPDLAVFVYDKEPGRGTREVLDAFLYGPGVQPPPPPRSDNYAVVGGNEEARSKLLSTPGAVAPLSAAFLVGEPRLAAVRLEGVEPAPDNVRSGAYAMARPLLLVTRGRPEGPARRFVDYLLSPAGQDLVRRHGFLSLEELGLR
jgi:phosphate transport system substrate-binding protein